MVSRTTAGRAALTMRPAGAVATRLRASVCIPSRNRAGLLEQTLQSLDRQSVGRDQLEVIVAVDGSTDHTIDMLRRLSTTYPLKWTRLEGRGSGAARNAAASQAGHEVLIFLDDDQIASPGLVAAHLDAHGRGDLVIVQGDYPMAAGREQSGASLIFERSRSRTIGLLTPSAMVPYHLWGANFSVRRETWALVGGFDEDLPRSQDLDFGLRVADLGVPLVIERQALSHHLHYVTATAYRRQCLSEGRCVVRISRKRGVPVELLLQGRLDRPVDRLLKALWVRYPRWADAGGRMLGGLQRAADLLGVKPAQLLSSRALRRFHELGGIAIESGR